MEEDTDGACGFGDEIGAGTARSLTARCLLEPVDLRFSLDSLVWLVLARGVERRVVKEGRLELLVGVLGVAKSSSWKPLNLESYDRWVPRVELRTPLPVRVGVEGEFWLKDRKDDFGVMASEGTAVADRTRRPDELPGRTERPDELLGRTGRPDELLGLLVWPKIVIFESLVVERVASDEGLLNTEGKSLDLLCEGGVFPFCCSVWSKTRSFAFSISSKLSCSVWLVEADLCLTLSTSRSSELVLSWRWRLSFSAFSREISVLLPRDLFNSASLASRSADMASESAV